MKRFFPILLLAALAAPVAAQQNTTDVARAAAEALEAASTRLHNAQTAEDRIAALSETLHAYEDGLNALREGLRRVAVRKTTLMTSFNARAGEIGDLLATMQTMERTPTQLHMLHPTGVVGTLRAGMLMGEIAPALDAEAADLRAQLQELNDLELLQNSAATTLEQGLAGAQSAREELASAMSNRADLPQRFTEDPIAMSLLLTSSETLAAFASGLSQTIDTELVEMDTEAWNRMGRLDLPVTGDILRRFNEQDAAGVRRPGLVIATRPNALVTTPIAATVRFVGPLLDMGVVVILEPAPNVLFIMTGLEQGFGAVGQIIPEGTPVGLMGGSSPDGDALLMQANSGSAQNLSETLYLEVREGQSAVDPAAWFAAH
ncbi:murein hydrolase activator EnvC family protein [Ketogulonicigenium vulgare]|uniref:murein hydrolase activator EnvC family protein n=1 Tax=Ketogulonicigenium vulgare TaxID=92945 RepID=UPI0023581066|nr:peptidase M23 [Ketogulonicigenium vulgare]